MTHSKLGRYQAPEPLSALARLHFRAPRATLKTVDHEPRVAVLDQEDLLSQGIRCSEFIPGATDVDALGSCTANTVIEALSRLYDAPGFVSLTKNLAGYDTTGASGYADAVGAERAAIGFYHGSTDLTADTSSEWPPTDCGSSGPYIEQYAQQLRLIRTARIANGADNIASVMQADGALLGMPWFNSMFTPSQGAFIDGNGTVPAIQRAIQSGVAGGHEIYLSAVEKLVVLPTGHVDPFKTVLRFRNHWTKAFGDHGSGRMHLSLLVALGGSIDVRQFVR